MAGRQRIVAVGQRLGQRHPGRRRRRRLPDGGHLRGAGHHDPGHHHWQRVRHRRHPVGAQPAERGQLPDRVAGRGGPDGGLPRHAAGRRLRDLAGLDPGAGAVRHVDVQRRAVLHRLHPAPCRHRRRQVLGGDAGGLHPHAKLAAHRHHDRAGVGRGAGCLAGAAVRLEGPRVPAPHQRAAALPALAGHRLPDLRHLLHLLRAAARHPGPVLEDLPDGAQAHSQAAGPQALRCPRQQHGQVRRGPPAQQEEVPAHPPLRLGLGGGLRGHARLRHGHGGGPLDHHRAGREHGRQGGRPQEVGGERRCAGLQRGHHGLHHQRERRQQRRRPRRGAGGGRRRPHVPEPRQRRQQQPLARAGPGADRLALDQQRLGRPQGRQPRPEPRARRQEQPGRAGRRQEGEEGVAGGEARAEGGQDAGHHHGRVRRLLAALLHHGAGHAAVRVVRHQRPRLQLLPLAGLLQLNAQPRHLHRLQPRVPAGVQAHPVRRPAPAQRPRPGQGPGLPDGPGQVGPVLSQTVPLPLLPLLLRRLSVTQPDRRTAARAGRGRVAAAAAPLPPLRPRLGRLRPAAGQRRSVAPPGPPGQHVGPHRARRLWLAGVTRADLSRTHPNTVMCCGRSSTTD